MKKLKGFLVTLCLLGGVLSAEAQVREFDTSRNNEFKINGFNLIIFKSVDLTYERILNPNAAIGVSLLANLQDSPQTLSFGDMPYYDEQFALTPYYRHFFMNRYAKGFFLEAFGMFNNQSRWDRNYFSDDEANRLGESTNVAVGIAVGGKIVSRRNFVFEFFGGVGRNIATSEPDVASEFVPRIGINLGYRF